jgi:tetratricopeptide (TPR) repeat protein
MPDTRPDPSSPPPRADVGRPVSSAAAAAAVQAAAKAAFDPATGRAAPELAPIVAEHLKRCEWDAIAALAPRLPPTLTPPWLWLADEVAFALSRLRRTDAAAALVERAYLLEPTHRRAACLAYIYYDVLLATRRPPRRGETAPQRDREADRRQFEAWMKQALRFEPDSIKDLYRLGVYEAQVQSQHDAPALRAFERAINAYRTLPAPRRASRPDLFKPYVRALYAGARSAFRLRRYPDARRLCFACIREDERTGRVEPVHKLFLAGKICAAQGQLDHAERALRLALDAKGPPRRDFVFAALADVARRAGRVDDAAAWIERHLEPHRRAASAWRLLGDIRAAQGRAREAAVAWENALRRDHSGRHFTLTRLGDLARAAGDAGAAARHYEQALVFRRRHYLSEHVPALAGLLALAEARGDAPAAVELERRIGAARPGRCDEPPDDLPDAVA